MALTRDYHSAYYSSTMSSHRHHHHHHPTSASSSSTSAPHPSTTSSPSSSHHRHTSSQPSPSSSTEGRRRRGRQARPSTLSQKARLACQHFASVVGAPQVVEPAGFRDFRGWLAQLNSRDNRHYWDQLLGAIASEVGHSPDNFAPIKEDIVREIIKSVVIPRPDESAKLVSTNAGRQASRPRSGTTLMVVLDQQLSRVASRLPELSVQYALPDDKNEQQSGGGRHRSSSSNSHRSRDDRLPSVSDILAKPSLPSFQELDASLKRRSGGGGSGGSGGSSSRR